MSKSDDIHVSQNLPNPLVIPLLELEEGLSIFQEVGSKPVSLRSKVQFFMDQKLYGRARHMLELLEDLGGHDGSLRLTLASLQILEGSLERAQATLDSIEQESVCHSHMLLCRAEIERHRWGNQAAIVYLKAHTSEAHPHLMARIDELQVADIQ